MGWERKALISVGVASLLMVVGCQSIQMPSLATDRSVHLSGKVLAAAQPVRAARVQMYAAGETGVASPAQPLLAAAVLSDSEGKFAVTEDVTCPSPTSQLYLVAQGGRTEDVPAGADNAALGAMTVLGSCAEVAEETELALNEATTVGSIWPLARYMTSSSELGSTRGDEAFASAAATTKMLRETSDGARSQAAIADGMAGPTQKLDALANLIGACMNSRGGRAGDGSACGRLFTLATEAGQEAPTTTIEAALHLARTPTLTATPLYDASTAALAYKPAAWSVAAEGPRPAVAAAMTGIGTATHHAAESALTAATAAAAPVVLNVSATISPGSTTSGLIVLSSAATSKITVTLSSSNQNYVTTPVTVAIPQGQTAANFQVSAKAAGSSTVSASVPGYGTASVQVSVGASGIAPAYFGMTVEGATTVTPAVSYGTTRSWDVSPGVSWADLNPSSGTYNFAALDAFLAVSASRGADVIYVFGRTPQWSSSKKATAGSYGPGQCAPPSNMSDWDNFVQAIATHAKGQIKYWEFWDEPNNPGTWCGDMPTFVTMAQHASQILKSVDPTSTLFSPTLTSSSGPAWLDWYLNSGGGPYADAIAFHGYLSVNAEDITTVVANYRAVMAKYGLGSKALWDTETSWAGDGNLPTPTSAKQVSFMAKEFLLNWSLGVSRTLWYAYDGGPIWGGLWTASGGLSPAGTAYGETYKWMVGATLTQPCSEDTKGNWTCVFTRPGGYQAQAMWNSTRPYGVSVPAAFVEYRDLAGGVHPVVKNNILLGDQPILAETSALPN